MTRTEEIKRAAINRADKHEFNEAKRSFGLLGLNLYSYSTIWKTEIDSFKAGVAWADNHPKSPWISVEDDLPCNHKELIHEEDSRFTKFVLVRYIRVSNGEEQYKDSCMTKYRSKDWIWTDINNEKCKVTHWMPIPEPPK